MAATDEGGRAGSPLLTLTEAAELLGVTESAVIQMLDKQRLAGPVFAGRAPNGAGRVTEESARALLVAREGAPRRGPSGPEPAETAPGRADGDEDASGLRARVRELEGELRRARRAEEAARAALLAMKATADQARETARQERKLNRSLTSEVARLSALLSQANEQTERVDATAQGYSDTLTGLLVPPDASELDGP